MPPAAAGLSVEVIAKVPSRYYRVPRYFFPVLTVAHTPPTGDRLVVAVGLTGSEDPADSVFRNLKGRSLPRVPQSGPQNPAMRVLKSPGTPFRACVRRALWRYIALLASILRS